MRALASQRKTSDLFLAWENPFPPNEWWKNIQHKYEQMKSLAAGYDKVWIVESDTIPPEDALDKLHGIEAPVVSGLYALRHGQPVPNLMRVGDSPATGDAMTWPEVQSSWGKVIPISGGCMGCLLIDTAVLRGFSFINDAYPHAPDRPFMQHCWSKGYKQMARLDVICGHKKPGGDILWPDKEQGYRLEKAA